MGDNYILVDEEPVACDDLIEWSKWYERNPNRHIALTNLENGTKVSTVFLALDHNFTGIGKPVLWETMIFGGKYDEYQWRYTSKEEAFIGHFVAVRVAKGEVELAEQD